MVRLDACSRFWWREAARHWPEVRPTPPPRRPIGGGQQQRDHWTSRTGASGYWWQPEVNFYPLVLKLGSNLIILKKDLQVNSCRLA